MRPKVKFLTAVWGEVYIARFASLALPSFLAPGNLPAMAKETTLEVVIMTRHSEIAHFEQHQTFRRLRDICPIRFVPIDDLITSAVYGVTLTLAYARAVIECGRDMLNTHFTFMNADFVLADGSLRSLCRHIMDGRSIVLGPSFRATAEMVEPQLQTLVDRSTGILAIAPRQLAALSLKHPHLTTVAKIRNQAFLHSTQPNQFFWQVDPQTLLGRYYLIFMLCLKPEREIKTINSYCDYSFIPEMCPSGDEVVMGDSDEFFMLELQQRDQELHLLKLGPQTENEIAASLQGWTTAEHRRAASHDVIFHVGEIPAEISASKAEASAFVERIGAKLARPKSHIGHRYWVRGCEAWQNYRIADELSGLPDILAKEKGQNWLLYFFWGCLYKSQRVLLGHPPRVTPFHPLWQDFRLLKNTVSEILSNRNSRILIIRQKSEFVDEMFDGLDVTFSSIDDILVGNLVPDTTGPVSHVICCLTGEDFKQLTDLTVRCRSLLGVHGTLYLFIRGDLERSDLKASLMSLATGPLSQASRCAFVGGELKYFCSFLFKILAKDPADRSKFAMIWMIPLLVATSPLTFAINTVWGTNIAKRVFPRYCSSAVVTIKSC
ncbi:MAG: hypothetical protein ACKVQK_17770 [Burkholderiales bacterium]